MVGYEIFIEDYCVDDNWGMYACYSIKSRKSKH